MKKLLIPIIGFVSVVACLAGTETSPVAPAAPSSPNWFSEASGLFSARQASLAIYPTWDPYIAVGGVNKPWGFGAAVLYPVSDYAFAGVRVDFLGNTFWAPSAVVGAKYTLKNVPLTPTVFTVGGLIMPMSGAGDQNLVAGAVTGVGATCVLHESADKRFSINIFVAGEKWTQFSGIASHLGLAGGIKF